MRSEGYGSCSVSVSVCLLPGFLPPRVRIQVNSDYDPVQCYTGLILQKAIFVKILRSKVTEQANMLISTGLPRLDCADVQAGIRHTTEAPSDGIRGLAQRNTTSTAV